ncbi:hypothetical protein VUR80DRAFT_7909 [Thermomyces stellatus]
MVTDTRTALKGEDPEEGKKYATFQVDHITWSKGETYNPRRLPNLYSTGAVESTAHSLCAQQPILSLGQRGHCEGSACAPSRIRSRSDPKDNSPLWRCRGSRRAEQGPSAASTYHRDNTLASAGATERRGNGGRQRDEAFSGRRARGLGFSARGGGGKRKDPNPPQLVHGDEGSKENGSRNGSPKDNQTGRLKRGTIRGLFNPRGQ